MESLENLCIEIISQQFKRKCQCGKTYYSIVELKCDQCRKADALAWLTESGYIELMRSYEECCEIFDVREGLLFIKSSPQMDQWIIDTLESFVSEDRVIIYDLLSNNKPPEPYTGLSVEDYKKINSFVGIREQYLK